MYFIKTQLLKTIINYFTVLIFSKERKTSFFKYYIRVIPL